MPCGMSRLRPLGHSTVLLVRNTFLLEPSIQARSILPRLLSLGSSSQSVQYIYLRGKQGSCHWGKYCMKYNSQAERGEYLLALTAAMTLYLASPEAYSSNQSAQRGGSTVFLCWSAHRQTRYFRKCQSSPHRPVNRWPYVALCEMRSPLNMIDISIKISYFLLLSFLRIPPPPPSSLWAWLITSISGGECLSPGKCVDTHNPVTRNPQCVAHVYECVFLKRERAGGHINNTQPD